MIKFGISMPRANRHSPGRPDRKKRREGPLWRRGNIVRVRAYLDNCRFHRGRRQILNSNAYACTRTRIDDPYRIHSSASFPAISRTGENPSAAWEMDGRDAGSRGWSREANDLRIIKSALRAPSIHARRTFDRRLRSVGRLLTKHSCAKYRGFYEKLP